MKWIYKLIFRIFVPKELQNMYAVEYQTSSMLEPKLFAYEFFDEDYEHRELTFTHETAGHTLTLNKDKLEWYSTTKIGTGSFYNN